MVDLRWLDEVEFYNYCQYYRHVPINEPAVVLEAFRDLKDFIRSKIMEAQPDAIREGQISEGGREEHP